MTEGDFTEADETGSDGITARQELGRELASIATHQSEAPPPPLPQAELLKGYTGELPPAYEATTASESERETDDSFYGTQSEVTRHPFAERAKDAEAVAHEREMTRRDAITLIDGMTLELTSKVGRIDGLRADLVDERRQIIRKQGEVVLDGLRTDARLQGRPEAMQQIRVQMQELMSPLNRVEPSPDADRAFSGRIETTRSFVDSEPQKITDRLHEGQMDAMRNEDYHWIGAVNKVSNLLQDVFEVDDVVRRDYKARLDKMLLISDPNASVDRVDLLSDTGKVIVEMQRRLMTREGMLTDPQDFEDLLRNDVARWKRDYAVMADRCSATATEEPLAA